MSAREAFAAGAPTIATKAEYDHLAANRPEPAPEMHLTPNGPETVEVNKQVNAMNEQRMAELQERLQRARDGMEHDHAQAVNHQHADSGHER